MICAHTTSREGMDEKDVELVRLLSENARRTLTEMAKILGISDVAVKKRLSKLEREGVIKRYTVVADPKKLGYNGVALIGVDAESDHVLKVAEELSKKDYAAAVYVTTGDHMIMVEVWARHSMELKKIVDEIGSMSGVKRVCPAIVLERLK